MRRSTAPAATWRTGSRNARATCSPTGPRPPRCAPTNCGLWLASFAYVLICAVRRVGLAHTQFAEATCGTIRLKLLKLAGLVRISARRIKFALASACPYADEWRLAAARLA